MTYREVGPEEVPQVHFGGGWTLDPESMAKAPESDVMEHNRLAALIEAEHEAYKEAQRLAEEAQHYREIEAAGKSKTLQQVFDEALAVEPREQVRRDAEERTRERNRLEGLTGDAEAVDLSDLKFKNRQNKNALAAAGREKDPSDPAGRRTRVSDAAVMAWAREIHDRHRRERQAQNPVGPRPFVPSTHHQKGN